MHKKVIFFVVFFADIKKMPTFAHRFERIGAQMAESVDALVSNTSRFTPVPVRPRLWVRREEDENLPLFLFVNLDARADGCTVIKSTYWNDI